MRDFTTSECMQTLACNYRQLVRLCVLAHILPNNATNFDALPSSEADRRAKVLTSEQVDMLRGLHAGQRKGVTQENVTQVNQGGLEARIAAQARQIAGLEARIRVLEGHKSRQASPDALQRDSDDIPPLADRLHVPLPRNVPVSAHNAGDTFPDGWLTVEDLKAQYQISPSTIRKATGAGRIAFHAGDWKRGRSRIKRAFDSEQVEAILRLYRPDLT